MHVLVATTQTQGQRDNDFCFVPEGELVKLGMTCDVDGDDPDGDCGCARSFVGFECSKATTTARVEDRDMTAVQYAIAYIRSEERDDWPVTGDRVANAVQVLLGWAEQHPVGTVLERRGSRLVPRKE